MRRKYILNIFYYKIVSTLLVGIALISPIPVAASTQNIQSPSNWHWDQWSELFSHRVEGSLDGYDCESSRFSGPVWDISNEIVKGTVDTPVLCISALSPTLDFSWKNEVSITTTLRWSENTTAKYVGIQANTNGDFLAIRFWENQVYIVGRINRNWIDFTDNYFVYDFEESKKYMFTLDWKNDIGELELAINEEHVFSTQQTSTIKMHAPKPALIIGSGLGNDSVEFLDFSISNQETKLFRPLPLYLQTDPLWKNLLYDSAYIWSRDNTTIGRWGCALTSAVMVLRGHGITQIPETLEQITPKTLNNWLRNQSDGYIYPGLLNWRSLSRLSWESKSLLSTTALEFSYQPVSNIHTWLYAELKEKKTPILDVGGHFVVASGVNSHDQSVAINDPLLGKISLSQYGNTAKSARVFTPSNTDLKALSLYVSPGTRISFNSTNASYDLVPIPIYSLDPNNQEILYWLYDITKPATDFSLDIFSKIENSHGLLFLYDTFGENTNTFDFPITRDAHTMYFDATTYAHSLTYSTNEHIVKKISNAYLAAELSRRNIVSPHTAQQIYQTEELLWSASDFNTAIQIQEESLLWLQLLKNNRWISEKFFIEMQEHWKYVLLYRFP